MKEELEQLVDSHGLAKVLDTLTTVCREKGNHLRSNWQDENAARSWERDADWIDTTIGTLEN